MNNVQVEFYAIQILLMNRRKFQKRNFFFPMSCSCFSHRFVLMTMINRSLSDQVSEEDLEKKIDFKYFHVSIQVKLPMQNFVFIVAVIRTYTFSLHYGS